ncbi:MAG TPA: hypothetical protein VMT11_05750 [Myxococcaceae bacterium]|nr:hypothetical protein [Myxococcaceae bacterium]
MNRVPRILLGLCLSACSGATLPPPTVVSVSPPERPASSSGPVTVTLDAVLPTLVDHGAGTATVDDRLTLKIGPRPFGSSRWTDAGVVTDFLPSVLPEGTYDVTVALGDGRLTTAADAFRVTAGDWPVGYTLDTIGDQTSSVPFGVTIRARGAPDGGYGGTVNLSVPGARVSPDITGAFVDGVRVEVITVTVDNPGLYHLDVSDLAGRTGRSLNFAVSQ